MLNIRQKYDGNNIIKYFSLQCFLFQYIIPTFVRVNYEKATSVTLILKTKKTEYI